MKYIDLNADIGEGFPFDKNLIGYISSANIACGLHSGSPLIMAETVRLAIRNNVSLGAHPSYPDREGFGRRQMNINEDELLSTILYQVGALKEIIKAEGGVLSHLKPHGALYNKASVDIQTARIIISSLLKSDRRLILFGQPGSILEKLASDSNVKYYGEFFADRAYTCDGTLLPRNKKGSLIEDSSEAVERTLKMLADGTVSTFEGTEIKINAKTICLHGDNKRAVIFAAKLHDAITSEGYQISSTGLLYD